MPGKEDETLTTEQLTIPADPPTFDRGEVEKNLTSKLADVFGDEDGLDEEDPEVTEAVEAEADPVAKPKANETTETEVESAAEDDAASTAEQAKETPKSTLGKVNPVIALPAAHRRSMKAYQWSDEEIDAALKADAPNFLRTAAKLHESRNEETKRMSDLGAQIKEKTTSDAAPAATETVAKSTALKKVDIAKLKAKYGDEPFIHELEGLNALVDVVNEVMPTIRASAERQRKSELTAISTQIDSFFASSDVVDYVEHYGKGGKLNDEQAAHRTKVLETADLLLAGAKGLGRSLTLEQALLLAHDSVSGPMQAQQARKTLVQKVQKRQAAVSLKPSARRATPVKAGDRKALESAVLTKLASTFKT